MDGITLEVAYKWLREGVMVFLVVAFIKGWIVPKWVYEKLEASIVKDTVPRWVYDKVELDCKKMTEIAERNMELAERASAVAERIVPVKEPQSK